MVTIAGKEHQLESAKLRGWLELEDIKFRIYEAVESKDRDELVNLIYLYVSTAIDIEPNTMSNLPYREVLTAFNEIAKINVITIDLPFMRMPVRGRLEDTGYEYTNRSWWSWANIFSTKYGWSLEYIANLDVRDGLYLYQEYLIDKYQEKEWQWMLSERYIGYDSQDHAKINKYPKPEWMQPKMKPPEIEKLPADMIPVGAVVRMEDLVAKPK